MWVEPHYGATHIYEHYSRPSASNKGGPMTLIETCLLLQNLKEQFSNSRTMWASNLQLRTNNFLSSPEVGGPFGGFYSGCGLSFNISPNQRLFMRLLLLFSSPSSSCSLTSYNLYRKYILKCWFCKAVKLHDLVKVPRSQVSTLTFLQLTRQHSY